MKYRLIDYTTIIVCSIIFTLAGICIGIVTDRIYHQSAFKKEITVSVYPMGLSVNPYDSTLQYGRINKQIFKVILKNGVQVYSEWIGYTFDELSAAQLREKQDMAQTISQ